LKSTLSKFSLIKEGASENITIYNTAEVIL
jgi:hypothetical protein